jgi:hypothetical protein
VQFLRLSRLSIVTSLRSKSCIQPCSNALLRPWPLLRANFLNMSFKLTGNLSKSAVELLMKIARRARSILRPSVLTTTKVGGRRDSFYRKSGKNYSLALVFKNKFNPLLFKSLLLICWFSNVFGNVKCMWQVRSVIYWSLKMFHHCIVIFTSVIVLNVKESQLSSVSF